MRAVVRMQDNLPPDCNKKGFLYWIKVFFYWVNGPFLAVASWRGAVKPAVILGKILLYLCALFQRSRLPMVWTARS